MVLATPRPSLASIIICFSSLPFSGTLVGNVLGIEPDANCVFIALDGDKFGVAAVSDESAEGCNDVEFILACGEKRVHNLHGNFHFDSRLFGRLTVLVVIGMF